ncbi:MAG TPA: hypothetical protein VF618_26755 [Thermoanaerobaculia bacterium]
MDAHARIADALLARGERWDPAIARELLAIARGYDGTGTDWGLPIRPIRPIGPIGPLSWRTRLLACLALEYQFRFLHEEDEPLLRDLGIDLHDTRRRIARNAHLHPHDFERHLDAPCRLYFARFAFTPAEVVGEILSRVRTTPAMHEMPPLHHPCNVDEAQIALDTLPPYEREIVRRLIAQNVCYWVADDTPSSINGLVEYPKGTVVLVIKPPGSDLELEIKRAGVRGPRPLDVRCDEGLPIHHHLWGGSRGDYLRHEAASSALFARVHRLAHGTEAAIPRIVTLCRVDYVPTADGDKTLLSYFDDPALYPAMTIAVDRLGRDDIATPDHFVAGQFVEATRPGQAILIGTSSFRLQRILPMLEEHDVDEILDEIIDDYVPVGGSTGFQSVEDALARNREAADRTYVSLLRQTGHLWGTLLGVRGSSAGESFVIRNVGLRKLWCDGRWEVRLISMDHDSLHIAGRTHRYFNPSHAMNSTFLDQAHILGGVIGKKFVPGQVRTLRAIYRVSDEVAAAGLTAFRAALEAAYAATQAALVQDEEARALFHDDFVDGLREWDAVVTDWMASRDDADALRRWRRRTRDRLRRRGLPKRIAEQYPQTIDDCSDLLPWFAPLYGG